MYAHGSCSGGVTQALCARTLELLQGRPQPALLAAMLTTLAAVLDAALTATAPTPAHQARWDWVTGGRAARLPEGGAPSPRAPDKLHRRKLHKKLVHQMQELYAARQGIQVALEEQQVMVIPSCYAHNVIYSKAKFKRFVTQRARLSLKARMAVVCKLTGSSGTSGSTAGSVVEGARLVSPSLGASLAHALVTHMLAMDSTLLADHLLLCAKVYYP